MGRVGHYGVRDRMLPPVHLAGPAAVTEVPDRRVSTSPPRQLHIVHFFGQAGGPGYLHLLAIRENRFPRLLRDHVGQKKAADAKNSSRVRAAEP